MVLLAVFVPVAFTPGLTGRLFEQFAATIAISVAISSINALTLSPALCATILRPPKQRGGLFAWFERGLDRTVPIVTTRHAAPRLQRRGFAAARGIDTWDSVTVSHGAAFRHGAVTAGAHATRPGRRRAVRRRNARAARKSAARSLPPRRSGRA